MDNIPEDFERIWKKEVYRSVSLPNQRQFKTESLFVHSS